MRPESTGRGKRPSHSRAQIAEAAIAIADEHGIDAVSMRRVAAEIGAGTMSLYRYVRNKDELYMLMANHVVEPAGIPTTPPPWQEALLTLARGTRATVLAHPWFPSVLAGLQFPGPNMLRGMEIMMASVDGLGLDIDGMLEVVTMVQTFAMGFAQNEAAESTALLRSGLDRDQQRELHGPYVQSLLDSGEFPYVKRIIEDAKIPHMSADDAFERGIQRIITGIEATLPHPSA